VAEGGDAEVVVLNEGLEGLGCFFGVAFEVVVEAGYRAWVGGGRWCDGDVVDGRVEVVERGVECIAAVVEGGSAGVVSVNAGSQGALEVGDGSAIDEVVEMLLRSAGWLEGSFNGCFAKNRKCGV
jgi:hypothetical protein